MLGVGVVAAASSGCALCGVTLILIINLTSVGTFVACAGAKLQLPSLIGVAGRTPPHGFYARHDSHATQSRHSLSA